MRTNQLPFKFAAYAITTLCLLVALLSGIFLEQTSQLDIPWLVLFLAVILSTWWGGFTAGLIAIALCTILASFFYVEPNHIFLSSIFRHNFKQNFLQTFSFALGYPFKFEAGIFIMEAGFLSWFLSQVLLSKNSSSKQISQQKTNQNVKNASPPEPSDGNYKQILKIFEKVSDGLVVFDSQDRILFVNKKAASFWGSTPEKLTYKKIGEIEISRTFQEINKKIEQTIATKRNFQFEEFLEESNQWFEIKVNPSAEGCLIYIQEISQRKQTEKQKQNYFQEVEKELQEQNKRVAEKSQREYAFLANSTKALAGSLDYHTTANKLAALPVPFLADYCLIYQIDSGREIYQVAAFHQNRQKQKLLGEMSKFAPEIMGKSESLVARVMQTGEAIYINETPTALEAIKNLKTLAKKTTNETQRQLIDELNPKNVMILPLLVRGEIWGTMLLAIAESNRQYNPLELSLAENLAHRAAVALENATLHQENQQTLEYQAQLLSLIAELYRQTQQALERKDELLSLIDALFAGAPVGVAFLDKDLYYIRINAQLAAINGLPVEQHLGKKFTEVIPKISKQIEPQLQQVLQTGQPILNVEINAKTAEKPPREGYWLANYYPVRNALDETVGIGIIMSEITDRKKAYQALQESEKRFRRLVESNIFGVAYGDFQGGINYANDYFLKMIGYSREEIEAKQVSWLNMTPPEYLELDLQAGEEIKQRGVTTPFEKEYLRKDGSRVPILIGSALLQEPFDQQQEIISFFVDLSERKKAEKARKESEERFGAMFNQASVGIALVGLDGQFLEVNPAMCKITGYSQQELLQLNFQKITHPDDLEADWNYVLQVRNREISGYSIEKRYIRKDGSIVWVNLSSSAVWDEIGQIKYGFGIIEDISERKQVQEALIESEERFRVMFSQAAIGISLMSLEGRFLQVNSAVCEITGYSLTELQQKHFQDITHPEDLEADIANLERLLAAEIKGYSMSKRYFHKNGNIVWVNITVSAVWDSTGHPKYAVAIIEDISGRRRSELAQNFLVKASTILAASLEWETTLSNLAQLAIPTLADGCFVDIFEETMSLRLLGVACSDPHKKELLEEIHRRYPPEHKPKHPILQRLRQGKYTFEPEVSDAMLQATAQNEEHLQMLRSLEIRSIMVIPLRSRGQLFGCVSFMKMATRHRYDRADLSLAEEVARRAASALDNARLYREAQEANRLKDEFLAVLSHELRTPLNAILGWTQLLQTRKFNESTTFRALETIDRNARTQAQLIEDLLDVSRIITGKLRLKPRWTTVQSLISQTIDTLRLAAEAKSIMMESIYDSSIDLMWVDPERFRQIVWNLLSNAIKFTPHEGRIEIELCRAGSFAEIRVTDTGIGIKPEFLPFVFDRFRQADGTSTRSYGGLGLGLAIVRHLVEIHGGNVSVFSEGEDAGTTFKVRLPFLTENMADLSQQTTLFSSRSFNNSSLENLRILVLDDEPDTLDLVSFTLEQYGAVVRKASSATEALEMLNEWLPDLLLSDIGMPQVDGYMLIRTLRERPPEQGGLLPAIALTAYAADTDRQQVYNAGFNCYLTKPVDADLLIQSISDLITGERVF